jgi:hypothetical protein
MPLIDVSSETTSLMEAAGLKSQEKQTLKELLKNNSLDTDSALGIVSAIAHCGDSDAIKLRAAEMALKMSGDLAQDDVKVVPVVNIRIVDAQSVSVNPILIPRKVA